MSSGVLLQQAAAIGHAHQTGVHAAFHHCRQLASQALASLHNAAAPASSASSQPATSTSTEIRPPIHVACVLERLPIVAPPPPAWETEYHDWLQQYRMAKRLRTDYPEVKHIYAPLAATRVGGSQEGQGNASSTAAGVQADAQLAGQATEATPLTPDDIAGHMKSMRRALAQRLYLLVKQPLDGWHTQWQFPHAVNQPGESIRQTCERALHTAIGRKYPVYFIGNTPVAHMPLLLPNGAKLFFMSAQVVDDPWGNLTLPEASPAKDYMWATRQEAAQHMADVRSADLLQRMLPE